MTRSPHVPVSRRRSSSLRWALAAWGALGAGCEALPHEGSPEHAGEIEAATAALTVNSSVGDLAIVTPPSDAPVANSPGKWVRVPGLVTGFNTAASENVAITVNADIESVSSTGHVWFRVLVDGAPVSPGDVVFKASGAPSDGAHSFTFVKSNLGAGSHVAEVQWFSNPGTGAAKVRRRTMVVESGPTSRLAVTSPASGANVSHAGTGWANVPGLSSTITTSSTRDLKVTVSGEVPATSGRFFLRALLDGVTPLEPGDVVFDQAGNPSPMSARSFTFKKWDVPAGTHTVTIQWVADAGGSVSFGDRSLAVSSVPASGTDGAAGANSVAIESANISTTNTGWTDLAGMQESVTIPAGAHSLAVSASLQGLVSGGATMFVRAVVGSRVASPPELPWKGSGGALAGDTLTFNLKDVPAGAQTVKLQWRSSNGGAVTVGDRAMNLLHKRRTGGDFVRPFYAADGASEIMGPQTPGAGKKVVFLCLDPVANDQNWPMHTLADVNRFLFGTDPAFPRNVVGYYNENTLGRTPINIEVRGCGGTTGTYQAPAGRRGMFTDAAGNRMPWYWVNGHALAWVDAINASNADVNYAPLDLNGDGVVAPSEATVVVLRPNHVGWGVVGLVRGIGGAGVTVDGVRIETVVDAVYPALAPNANPGNQRGANLHTAEVGNLSHELGHTLFNGPDMYDDDDGGGPDRFFEADFASLMDRHYFHPHFDPFHKLKLGWIRPNLLPVNSFTPGTINLTDIERTGEALIIYDPARGDSEYFIVENRFRGTSYDSNNQMSSGPYVWHVVEDFTRARSFASSSLAEPNVSDATFAANAAGVDDWGRFTIRFLGSVGETTLPLRFTGNAAASIRISNTVRSSATIGVTVAAP